MNLVCNLNPRFITYKSRYQHIFHTWGQPPLTTTITLFLLMVLYTQYVFCRPTSGCLFLATLRRSKTFLSCRAMSGPLDDIVRIIPFNRMFSISSYSSSRTECFFLSLCSRRDPCKNSRGKLCIENKTEQVGAGSKTEYIHTDSNRLYTICRNRIDSQTGPLVLMSDEPNEPSANVCVTIFSYL